MYNSYDDKYLRKQLKKDKNHTDPQYNLDTFLPNIGYSNYNLQIYPNNNYIPNYYPNIFPPIQNVIIKKPVKYFFQKPIYLSDKEVSYEKQTKIKVIKNQNNLIHKFLHEAKWGKPVRMQDVLSNKSDYNLRLLNADDVVRIKNEMINNNLKIKEKIEEDNMNYQYHMWKENEKLEKRRKIREGNKKYWNILRKFLKILKLYNILREFTLASIKFKRNKILLYQSSKMDIVEFSNMIGNSLKSIGDLASSTLIERFIIDSNFQNKTDDTIFRAKTFIHQILHDLSKNMTKNFIQSTIKISLLKYISNGAILPEEFLTTFEFNRLEFDINMRLFNMKLDRQAMMIGFILLYRILILEILMNYKKYFKNLMDLEPPSYSLKSSDDIRERIIGRTKLTKEKIQENFEYNFSFICVILNEIMKNVFTNSPKICREYFKEIHVYKKYVLDAIGSSTIDIFNRIENDSIEFTKKLPHLEKAEEFIQQNTKWINMHQITVLSLCMNLVENILRP